MQNRKYFKLHLRISGPISADSQIFPLETRKSLWGELNIFFCVGSTT